MDKLLQAILDDDPPRVKQLLKADPFFATRLFEKPKLYQSKIFHWIYVGDTALHLAAAGYRVEIMRLLLNAGADPNAAQNHRRSSPLHYAADGCVGGVAWNSLKTLSVPSTLFGTSSAPHPFDIHDGVASTGLALRVNLFGFAVGEFDFSHPFQRPGRGWVFQFNLAPGF